jgi:hypothetical protein
MTENTKTNWDEIAYKSLGGKYDFATLSDKMLMNCVLVVCVQLQLFHEMDNGNISVDDGVEYVGEHSNEQFLNTENDFIQVANTAKIAHEMLPLLKVECFDVRHWTQDRFTELYKIAFDAYAKDNCTH